MSVHGYDGFQDLAEIIEKYAKNDRIIGLVKAGVMI